MNPHSLLASELALPIHRISACRTVEFVIRMLGVTVKDVIRGNRDKPHAVPMASRSYIRTSTRVETKGKIPLRLASVNRSHGSAMDNYIGCMIRNYGINRILIRNIRFGKIGGNYLEFATEFSDKRSP